MWADLKRFLGTSLGLDGNGALVAELFAIVLAVVVLNFLAGLVLRQLQSRLERTRNPWDDALVDAGRVPLYWLIWVLGLAFSIEVFQGRLDAPAAIFAVAEPAREIAVIGLLTWFLLRLVGRVEANLVLKREQAGRPVDRTTADAIGKLVRLAVVITAVLVTLQTLGFSVSGVLAFGGIGGIAVGFAAKDLLANFFGGLTIYMDRPFSVGDWIRSPDRNIEGTVEHIGWRLTRIRTFDQRPLYVPNSTFNSIALENPSRMLNRRIFETIGIRYADWRQMGAIVAAVKQMLVAHPEIEAEQRTLIVNFTSFNASSLDFFIYTFTKTTEWVRYHEIKQDVLLRVMAIIDEHGAEIAFPTSTIHMADVLRLQAEDVQEAGGRAAG